MSVSGDLHAEAVQQEAAEQDSALRRFQTESVPLFADALMTHPQILNQGDGRGGWAMQTLSDALAKRGVTYSVSLTLNMDSAVSDKTKERIASRDHHRCQACGARSPLQIDHKMPRSRGGDESDDNLWVLCGPCNRDKADRTVEEWEGDAS